MAGTLRTAIERIGHSVANRQNFEYVYVEVHAQTCRAVPHVQRRTSGPGLH